MAERPILFSGPMVRAILAGTKTQTRRLVRAVDVVDDCASEMLEDYEIRGYEFVNGLVSRPPGRIGDVLWVRETWGVGRVPLVPMARPEVVYRADGELHVASDFWRPSIHMRRAYARLLLSVKAVRAEWLHDISEADARAEGITDSWPEIECNSDRPFRDGFRWLWESINGERASWGSNPLVWVIEFARQTE